MAGPVTLTRFLDKTADALLADAVLRMATASKTLSRAIRRAPLEGRLGSFGAVNATGDAQKKMDVYSNDLCLEAYEGSRSVAAIVSEEIAGVHAVAGSGDAPYLLAIDPLDGSSNTDVDGTLGTIFAFFRRASTDAAADLLAGAPVVAAGYVLYGPGTLLVLAAGRGAHGFTLDEDVGEYLLTHEDIRCPAKGRTYGGNLGNSRSWDPGVRAYCDHVTETDPATQRPYSLRYSGALVGDFHRILLEGGIYLYPADEKHADGKLRLLYECAPLAFVAEAAGGLGSTGTGRVLDVRPKALHHRVPFAVGSREEVLALESFVKGR